MLLRIHIDCSWKWPFSYLLPLLPEFFNFEIWSKSLLFLLTNEMLTLQNMFKTRSDNLVSQIYSNCAFICQYFCFFCSYGNVCYVQDLRCDFAISFVFFVLFYMLYIWSFITHVNEWNNNIFFSSVLSSLHSKPPEFFLLAALYFCSTHIESKTLTTLLHKMG